MERTYVVGDKTVVLEVDDNFVAVKFKGGVKRSSKAILLETLDADLIYRSEFEIPGEGLTLIPVSNLESNNRASNVRESLSNVSAVEYVKQVYNLGDIKLVASELISIGLEKNTSNHSELFKEFDLQVVDEIFENEYLVHLGTDRDAIELVIDLNEDKRVNYAEPDFINIGEHLAKARENIEASPTGGFQKLEPSLKDQYAVFITEADKAWRRSKGKRDIKIAILDEGVDTRHPDLKNFVVGMYDATDNDGWQEPNSWDAHGTSCAGLAAAIPNRIGIRGIGGGCSLLAVRIAYSPKPKANWVTRNDWIRRAIDWSWKNGADVISNSWGGGAYSQAIVNAFERARTRGRGGKGSIIVIAAGNDAGPVSFPGNTRNVLTVSASNEYDEFKTKTSRDGEYWWGSNFGPEIDVAAPGVHNLTTDILRPDGYNVKSDYTYFNGTSSATPIVAGACGLILSMKPSLSEKEVRDAIVASADKVGKFRYSNGRNDYFGFGRLNVNKSISSL